MRKHHLYIIQFFGILMLICGYLLSDQPDNLSIMNFDLASPKVISAPLKIQNSFNCQVAEVDHQNPGHETERYKNFSSEVILPFVNGHECLYFSSAVKHKFRFRDSYCFLYFKEINPPPPKC